MMIFARACGCLIPRALLSFTIVLLTQRRVRQMTMIAEGAEAQRKEKEDAEKLAKAQQKRKWEGALATGWIPLTPQKLARTA